MYAFSPRARIPVILRKGALLLVQKKFMLFFLATQNLVNTLLMLGLFPFWGFPLLYGWNQNWQGQPPLQQAEAPRSGLNLEESALEKEGLLARDSREDGGVTWHTLIKVPFLRKLARICSVVCDCDTWLQTQPQHLLGFSLLLFYSFMLLVELLFGVFADCSVWSICCITILIIFLFPFHPLLLPNSFQLERGNEWAWWVTRSFAWWNWATVKTVWEAQLEVNPGIQPDLLPAGSLQWKHLKGRHRHTLRRRCPLSQHHCLVRIQRKPSQASAWLQNTGCRCTSGLAWVVVSAFWVGRKIWFFGTACTFRKLN